MSTRLVTGTILTPDGEPWDDFTVAFTLAPSTYGSDATYPERRVSVQTDAAGEFSVPLATNVRYDVAYPDLVVTAGARSITPKGSTFAVVVPEGEGAIRLEALQASVLAPAPPNVLGVVAGMIDPLAARVDDVDAALDTKADASALSPITADGWVTLPRLGADVVAAISRSPQTISGLGDSITIGDSSLYGTQWSLSTTFFGRLVMTSGGRLRFVQNWGVAGHTTRQIIDTRLALAVADASTLVTVMAGTNDVGQGVPLATTQANLATIWDALIDAGKTPILFTIPPSDLPFNLAPTAILNAWIRSEADRRRLPLVDAYAALVDHTDGTFLAIYNDGDGTHPNAAGRKAIAIEAWSVVSRLVPGGPVVPLPTSKVDSASMIVNGTFSTDANADGVADGWTAAGGTANIAYSLADRPGWRGRAQKAVLSGNTGAFLTQSAPAGWAVGDVLRFCGRVNAVVADGTVWQPFLFFTGGAIGQMRPIAGQAPTMDADDWVWCVDMAIPNGTTIVSVRLQAGTGTGTVEWGQVGLYNLTALGIA